MKRHHENLSQRIQDVEKKSVLCSVSLPKIQGNVPMDGLTMEYHKLETKLRQDHIRESGWVSSFLIVMFILWNVIRFGVSLVIFHFKLM